MVETDQVLLHHLDLLGQLEQGLQDFCLHRRAFEVTHVAMHRRHDLGDLVATIPQLPDCLISIHGVHRACLTAPHQGTECSLSFG